jgi:hypothetical protein
MQKFHFNLNPAQGQHASVWRIVPQGSVIEFGQIQSVRQNSAILIEKEALTGSGKGAPSHRRCSQRILRQYKRIAHNRGVFGKNPSTENQMPNQSQ